MDVVSLCPVRVASLVWRPSSGGFALTVIGKATFDLRPGELRLAEQQEDPNEDDDFWDDDPHRSVHSPGDLVPFKPRADVVLVGQAFAPGKVPARSLLVRIAVSGVDKTVEVCGDRGWTPEAGVREGVPFTSMQLRYERAANGAENPVGVRIDAGAAGPLPNLQAPGSSQGRRVDAIAPVGFGPIAARWPARRAKLGRWAASFPPRRWEDQLLPEDLDASFFNVAPPDQQPERITAGDRLVLENLSPQHPRLVSEVPHARPRAFVDRGNGLEEVALVCDTLWIDTDRAVCTLTWRGQIGLHGPADEGCVSFLLDQPSRPLRWSEIQAQCSRSAARSVEDQGTHVDEGSGEGTREYRLPRRQPSFADGALPFVSNAAPEPLPPARPAASTPPWLEAGARPAPAPNLGSETVLPGALRVPPRWPHETPSRPISPAPLPSITPRAEPPPPAPPPPLPVMSSVLAASNLAAVATLEPVPPSPEPAPLVAVAATIRAASSEIIDLLWFDPKAPDRVRLHLPWQELVAKLRPAPAADEDDPIEDPPEVVDRRDVFNLIAEGEPHSLDDLDVCLASATTPKGAFTPPLALVSGELELTFDDLETLKATLAAIAPFTAGPDKKLKDAFEAATEGLQSPWIQATGRATEGLTTRLRDAFAQGNWSLPAGYLDQQVERILVEKRHHQRRELLGETWIRALLGPPGAAARAQKAQGVPVYLPPSLAGKLPLYPRLVARLVVEVHLQQDAYETNPHALRCLALARVAPARPPRVPGKAPPAR
jgi:hypothetical protein